jgi:TDG/mug DNA glycosylase family protein
MLKPTPVEIRAAAGKTVPDVIAPGLKILFVGINPGLYSAAIGHHFGRPGNRFWPALHLSGLTPRHFSPYEDGELLELGYGITNVATRATAVASELSKAELLAGAEILEAKIRKYAPRLVAVLGIGVYRSAFARPKAVLGFQPEGLAGVELWVLPNPSGLNAHFGLEELARLFRQVKEAAEADKRRGDAEIS